jgi:hypothetical protein
VCSHYGIGNCRPDRAVGQGVFGLGSGRKLDGVLEGKEIRILRSFRWGLYRANGLGVNMAEFEKALFCKAGQPMVKENRCSIW